MRSGRGFQDDLVAHRPELGHKAALVGRAGPALVEVVVTELVVGPGFAHYRKEIPHQSVDGEAA